LLLPCHARTKSSSSSSSSQRNLQDLNYRVYPRRTPEEAAVLEWGHSALISAIDASVAHFGPQTSEAALFEVETTPVVAEPTHGWNGAGSVKEFVKAWEESSDEDIQNNITIPRLDNADQVRGNLVVMTDTAGMTGVQMALIAQESGAEGLLIVHVDDKRPDDIYRSSADK
jgi:hypothetical protein